MPWARKYPAAEEALRVAWPAYEAVDVSVGRLAYARLVQRLWLEMEPFILVEHDIVVRPDTIRELVECDGYWCAFPYLQVPAPSNTVTGLGCTKFDSAIMAAFSFPLHWDPLPIWQNVDVHLAGRLKASGAQEHRHEPSLRHLRLER